MVTSDDVRQVASALPRAYEVEVRGRAKYRVGQIVFVAFSRDEREMGFGFPKAERDGLVAADPETFYLPGATDLRYHWVCAHLDRLDGAEMRELVIDAWRMCTPAMLHDLPDQPEPVAQVWALIDRQRWHDVRPLAAPVRPLPGRRRLAAWSQCGARPPPGSSHAQTADRGRGPRRAGPPLAPLSAGPSLGETSRTSYYL
ncbi:MAG: MmcQ/YjbR family DNA-binding protein [Nocardioides sp.]